MMCNYGGQKFTASNNVKDPRSIDSLSNELIRECKCLPENAHLSKIVRDKLERFPRDVRKEIVKIKRIGCAPLFIACKRGNAEIAEYLISICGADMEQKGMYEVPQDRSVHCVTPLWCAAVSGKLPVLKCLVRLGANINALSDTGSTPVRSACFMTNLEVVQYLVQHGADIKKPNFNGGTCLINSVQSVKLCLFLISKGADVNAKDTQDKSALHYAIQEQRLETTKLLLEHGADPFLRSRCGDDALQMACLKGTHQIFDLLKSRVAYSTERLADAHELIGSTFLDEHNETRVAILHWRLAHHIRLKDSTYIPKRPTIPLRPAYNNAREFTTLAELDNIATDVDAMRIQSLLICERILGINHKDTIYRLMFRGGSYADSLRFQRCIDLWSLVLEVRSSRYSILYSDTYLTAQAVIRLMLDLLNKNYEVENLDYGGNGDQVIPRFSDVFSIFSLLTQHIMEAREFLQIRPVYRKHQENFDRVLKCISHLIYLLVETAKTDQEKIMVFDAVRSLVYNNVRSVCTNDTLLHLCLSRLNVIKSSYFIEDSNPHVIFPNLMVIKLLISVGANVNAKNDSKSTTLHIASNPYNYDADVVRTLLDNDAHLDQPNRKDERPIHLIAINANNVIPLMNYTTLKCLAATVITKYKIPYRNNLPKTLEEFVKLHEA